MTDPVLSSRASMRSRPVVLVLLREPTRTEGLELLLGAIGDAAEVTVGTADAVAIDPDSIEVIVSWNGGNPRTLFAQLGRIPVGLRWIHHSGVGVDKFFGPDLAARGIEVTNVRGLQSYADGIAEFVMGLVLLFAKRYLFMQSNREQCKWVRLEHAPLAGARIGIIGLGAVGRAVAVRAQAFGMLVGGTRRNPARTIPGVRTYGPDDLREVLSVSEYLVLSAAHTPETHHIINRETLAQIPREAVLINVARGGLIDEAALVEALQNHWIAAAALDVFNEEPLGRASALWRVPNLFISPHVAGSVAGARAAKAAAFAANLGHFIRGEPLCQIIDDERGY